MSRLTLIDDGMTLEARVPARPPLHPDVHFTYRPATAKEVSRLLRQGHPTPEEDWKADAALVASHVLSWDVQAKAADGVITTAPISPDSLARLPAPLFTALLNFVCGYATSGEQERSEKN